MRYAISMCLFPDLPLGSALRKCGNAGFPAVELNCGDSVSGQWYVDPAAAARTLREIGISADSVHGHSAGWALGAFVEADRLAALEKTAECFGPAAEVGAGVVVVHANSPTPEHPATEADYGPSMDRTRESLAVLAERAKGLGLRLALENLPARGTPRPSRNIEDVLFMIDGMGDHVGVIIDAGHSNANGRDAAQEVRKVGDRLFATHIQDSDGLGEDQHLVPGQGTVDWDAFLDALDECAPDALRTIEMTAGSGEPDEVLAAVVAVRDRWNARNASQ